MYSDKQTKIEKLRTELKKLMEQRENAQYEKGTAAENNKDLRENADYDYWMEKEMNLTVRIRNITSEIEKLYNKEKKNKIRH